MERITYHLPVKKQVHKFKLILIYSQCFLIKFTQTRPKVLMYSLQDRISLTRNRHKQILTANVQVT